MHTVKILHVKNNDNNINLIIVIIILIITIKRMSFYSKVLT